MHSPLSGRVQSRKAASRPLTVVLALLTLSPWSAAAQEARQERPFSVGGVQAAPGTRSSGYLEVAEGVDEGTRVPVTVLHGDAPGPVLALIAGTHGYEYAPMLALQNVRADLDPGGLSGTVILVHVANMPSFLGRTIYYSPVDGENLNRVYPGDPDGTVSERIADVITTEVIERSDFVVDMHAGDGNEALRPYLYMPVTGQRELDRKTRSMALAFGLDHIVIDDGRPADPENSRYVDQTGISRGIPSMTTETGQLGSTDAHWVSMAERGVWSLLAHLEMIDAEVPENEGVVWLGDYEVVEAPATGMFRPAVRDGYAVSEGTLLGTLVDVFGDPVTEIRAPFAGIVNYVIATPPVSAGEPVAMVSRIVEEGG